MINAFTVALRVELTNVNVVKQTCVTIVEKITQNPLKNHLAMHPSKLPKSKEVLCENCGRMVKTYITISGSLRYYPHQCEGSNEYVPSNLYE